MVPTLVILFHKEVKHVPLWRKAVLYCAEKKSILNQSQRQRKGEEKQEQQQIEY